MTTRSTPVRLRPRPRWRRAPVVLLGLLLVLAAACQPTSGVGRNLSGELGVGDTTARPTLAATYSATFVVA